jgi:integrase/recombinase XerD
VSGFYAFVVARGDTRLSSNPVPRGLSTRREGGSKRSRTVPLVRVPRTLPKTLSPVEVDRSSGPLRTHRDRALILAMVLGGLGRYEGLGLRLEGPWVGGRRVFVRGRKWSSAGGGDVGPVFRRSLSVPETRSGVAEHPRVLESGG